jgi:hypothetical protein
VGNSIANTIFNEGFVVKREVGDLHFEKMTIKRAATGGSLLAIDDANGYV